MIVKLSELQASVNAIVHSLAENAIITIDEKDNRLMLEVDESNANFTALVSIYGRPND